MKHKRLALLICLAIPLIVGGISSLLVGDSYSVYASYETPPLAPPGWVFPVVWSALYLLMGYASYLIYTTNAPEIQKFQALCLYAVQLAVNFAWPLFFFRASLLLSAFFVILLLWLLILVTWVLFSAIRERAGTLLFPYLLWVTFAGYLNFGFFLLN